MDALAEDAGRGLDPERGRQLSFVKCAHRLDGPIDRRVLTGVERALGVREFAR
jgi:hypothetical protein